MKTRDRKAPCRPVALVVCLGGFGSAAAAPTPAAPAAAPVAAVTPAAPVARVLIYPDRALVTRERAVACGARVRVAFGAIPPAADPDSVRAAVSRGTLDGVRVQVLPRVELYAPRLRQLEGKIREEEAALATAQDAAGRAVTEAQVAADYASRSVTLVGREMLDPAPNTRAFAAAFDGVLRTQIQAGAARVQAGAQAREVARRLAELRAEWSRLGGGAARDEREAEVVVTCPAGERAQVGLSYLVGGVSWTPAYEARLSPAGDRVDLLTFATVQQHTGEDWRGAQLVLSTALPQKDATPPELAPLYVRTGGEATKTKVVVSRNEYTRHAEAPAGLGGMGGAKNDARMGVAAQGLSVQLHAPDKTDVPADGVPVRVFVARTRAPAQLRLRSVPKLCPYVFRVADLVNGAPFPLLAGPLDLFHGARFLGRQEQERVGQGERFTLTFGIEDQVKIRREVIEEAARDRGFFGPARRRRYGYRFQLNGYLARPDAVEIAEPVPVSELADIKVGLEGTTTPGYALRGADGILSWRVPLPAGGARRDLTLRYYVEVPASYDTGAD